jgi:hypothetical protein
MNGRWVSLLKLNNGKHTVSYFLNLAKLIGEDCVYGLVKLILLDFLSRPALTARANPATMVKSQVKLRLCAIYASFCLKP